MSNQEVLVSIVIPVFNTLPYFKKCLDSLTAQTLSEIEIIVVDDGSTQDIRSTVDQYIDMCNIKYIRNEKPLGPGGARNKGLEIAVGKYISFCDSDDWIDLDYYESISEHMNVDDVDIVMVSMRRVYPSQISEAKEYMCHYIKKYSLSSEMAIRVLGSEYDMGIKIIPACMNKIYRREFIRQIGARFQEGMYFQGVLFTIFTFLRANRILCIPDVEYHHYRRKDSIVQSFDNKHIVDFEKCFKIMKAYFEEVGLYDNYKTTYYNLCMHYLDIVVLEIFQFVPNDEIKKVHLKSLLSKAKNVVDMDEFFEYADVEKLRRHIQPSISDPRLY